MDFYKQPQFLGSTWSWLAFFVIQGSTLLSELFKLSVDIYTKSNQFLPIALILY